MKASPTCSANINAMPTRAAAGSVRNPGNPSPTAASAAGSGP